MLNIVEHGSRILPRTALSPDHGARPHNSFFSCGGAESFRRDTGHFVSKLFSLTHYAWRKVHLFYVLRLGGKLWTAKIGVANWCWHTGLQMHTISCPLQRRVFSGNIPENPHRLEVGCPDVRELALAARAGQSTSGCRLYVLPSWQHALLESSPALLFSECYPYFFSKLTRIHKYTYIHIHNIHICRCVYVLKPSFWRQQGRTL